MKKPPDGDGPFQRGERLTAAKLNAAVTHNPMATAGNAFVMGGAVGADETEGIYLKLTAVNGTSPRKYSWQEVFRTANGTWQNGTRTGNYTSDYAIEINNSNLSTSDGYVYRAERSPDSAEWLFFLRRSPVATCDPVTGLCTWLPVSVTGNVGTSPSGPTGSPPIWIHVPGTITYGNNPLPGCPQNYYPDGLTQHRTKFIEAMQNAIPNGAKTISVPAPNTPTIIDTDISSSISPWLPKTKVIKYLGPGLDGSGCYLPEVDRGPFTTTIVLAVSRMTVTLTLNPTCGGYQIVIQRSVRVELEHKLVDFFYGDVYDFLWLSDTSQDVIQQYGSSNVYKTQVFTESSSNTTFNFTGCSGSTTGTQGGVDWVFVAP